MSDNKKVIKVTYPLISNAGDALNKPLIEHFSGAEVVKSKAYESDMIAIGGGLSNLQYGSGFVKRTAQAVLGATAGAKPIYVWGSGFIFGAKVGEFYRKNIQIRALRGELSRRKASGIMKKDIDVPLCDAGLLIDALYPVAPKKEYRLGIISHYLEKDMPCFKKLYDDNADSLIIDITDSAEKVLENISKCEVLISSSLHGLIFADSVGVPNLHLKVTDRLMGDGFKFKDYYSSFGLEHNCWDLDKTSELPTIRNVIDSYQISEDAVNKKKIEMINAFPEELKFI